MDLIIKMMNKYFKALSVLTYFLVAIVIIVVVIDVAMRWFIGMPLSDTIEVIRLLLPIITYLPLAYTLCQDKHINVVAVIDKLSVRLRKILIMVAYLIGIICTALITISCWGYFLKSWAVLELASGTKWYIPVYVAKFAIFIGIISMMIAYVFQFYYVICCKRRV